VEYNGAMPMIDVVIPAADGDCAASLHVPEGEGPWPAVIMYPDAGGLRPTFRSMGERLSGLGYVVLVPDVYYRSGGFEPFSMTTVFSDEKERQRLFSLMSGLTPEMSVRDAGAFLDYLASRPEVAPGPVGTTGYCMGGRLSLTVAGSHGDRIGAAASFHGGRLAVEDDPNSPDLLADQVKAVVYVAAAKDDGSFPEEQAQRLSRAYEDAGVRFTMETYPALHGFAVPDNPTFDDSAAERHWEAMERLYGEVLGNRT
jgi:carboxymethylenebutenolidase